MTISLPPTGRSKAEVLAALADQRSRDLKSDGRAFAFVYDAGNDLRELAREAFASCMTINGLDPTVYPSARKIENQVVGMCLDFLNAPEGAVGSATAGGTESVMCAVKAARDFHKDIKTPKMLLPVTGHPCFHKGAHYFGVEVVPVAVDPTTFKADVEDARRKMTDDVVLVVGSAPSYAHGVIDPIPELAALAKEHGKLMHVDACVGGCVLPFMRANGVDVAPFDFSVDGVTSMSCDLHKYGFAPKGVSVVLHRSREVRDAQYFACAAWTGYAIVNATTLSSKSLAAMGAAFAVMHNLGREGYKQHAASMWQATEKLVDGINATDGLTVLGRPEMNLFAFTTTGDNRVMCSSLPIVSPSAAGTCSPPTRSTRARPTFTSRSTPATPSTPTGCSATSVRASRTYPQPRSRQPQSCSSSRQRRRRRARFPPESSWRSSASPTASSPLAPPPSTAC